MYYLFSLRSDSSTGEPIGALEPNTLADIEKMLTWQIEADFKPEDYAICIRTGKAEFTCISSGKVFNYVRGSHKKKYFDAFLENYTPEVSEKVYVIKVTTIQKMYLVRAASVLDAYSVVLKQASVPSETTPMHMFPLAQHNVIQTLGPEVHVEVPMGQPQYVTNDMVEFTHKDGSCTYVRPTLLGACIDISYMDSEKNLKSSKCLNAEFHNWWKANQSNIFIIHDNWG